MDRDKLERDMLTMPAQFCAIYCISDGRYHFGDETQESQRGRNEHKNNVGFY